MKKFTTVLAVMAILFGLSGKAQAVPMSFTFEGTVTFVDDAAGAIAAAGLSFGSAVTYTFIMDIYIEGFYTQNDGTVVTMISNYPITYFYTDYVSGDALAQVDGGYYNADGDVAEYNYGLSNEYSWNVYIGGNTGNSSIGLSNFDRSIIDWDIGTAVAGYNYVYDSTGAFSTLETFLEITDISPVSAVPEPSTLLLLGSGLIGLGFFRRKTSIA